MNKTTMQMGLILLVSAFTFGCQTVPYQGKARNVKLKPKKEGVIALPNDPRPEDRNKANQVMKMNCSPKAYEVLEEGEAVIGQTKNSRVRQRRSEEDVQLGSLFGVPVTSSGSARGADSRETTTQLKEWRINYKCVAAK